MVHSFLLSVVAWLRARRGSLRPIFHWQFSGWFIALAVGVGMSLPFADQYGLAYFLLSIAGIAGVVFWLTSEHLEERRRVLTTRKLRRNHELLNNETAKYRWLEWSPVIAIVVCTCGTITWVSRVEWDRKSTSVNQALAIQYALHGTGDPALATFDVANNTPERLGEKHRWLCRFRDVVFAQNDRAQGIWTLWSEHDKKWYIWGDPMKPPPESDMETTFAIDANGDADSTSCLSSGMRFSTPVVCADIEVWFQYYLAAYPDRLQTSKMRVLTTPSGSGYEWRRIPFKDPKDYCTGYVKQPGGSYIPAPALR
jgi:hypothetical protein